MDLRWWSLDLRCWRCWIRLALCDRNLVLIFFCFKIDEFDVWNWENTIFSQKYGNFVTKMSS